MRIMFCIVRWNSLSKVSETTLPSASVEAWPDTNSKFPTLVAGLNGRGVLDVLESIGYSIMLSLFSGIGVPPMQFEGLGETPMPRSMRQCLDEPRYASRFNFIWRMPVFLEIAPYNEPVRMRP